MSSGTKCGHLETLPWWSRSGVPERVPGAGRRREQGARRRILPAKKCNFGQQASSSGASLRKVKRRRGRGRCLPRRSSSGGQRRAPGSTERARRAWRRGGWRRRHRPGSKKFLGGVGEGFWSGDHRETRREEAAGGDGSYLGAGSRGRVRQEAGHRRRGGVAAAEGGAERGGHGVAARVLGLLASRLHPLR